MRVAVIGAGMSGLTIAHQLSSKATVTVFEKARGPGGRLATRRADPYAFDHGAPFFTAKSLAFKEFLKPLIDRGIIARWDARFAQIDAGKIARSYQWSDSPSHFVAVPGMNQLAKALAEDCHIISSTRITHCEQHGGWILIDDSEQKHGPYDWLINTSPPAQAADLYPKHIAFHDELQSVKMTPCFSMMCGYDREPKVDFDAALVSGMDISWISMNHRKPGRTHPPSILVHATNRWAESNIEQPKSEIIQHMLTELEKATGISQKYCQHTDVHRWLYANIIREKKYQMLVDEHNKTIACGDWCIRGIVEAAFTSAQACIRFMEDRVL